MSIVIADRAIELAENLDSAKLLLDSRKTGDHVGELLAQCCRAGCLAVRS